MGDSRIPADVNDAVFDLVKAFGAERLAKKTGTPAGTIYNKANPHETSHHKPTLSDILIWTQITGDYRVVQALCRALDGAFVAMHTRQHTSDLELLDIVCKRDSEQGQFADALSAALADGRVSRADYQRLRREGWDVVTAWLELIGRIEGMADER
jgi:hypothetical protein